MNERRTLVAAVALAAFMPLVAESQSWPPPTPTGCDSRILIAGGEIREDRVTVIVPYGYGQQNWQENNCIDEWAQWGCSLYQRKAVGLSFAVSDAACDQMGQAAAMRNPDCGHFHHYACGIPPK